ncbi:hypothetical protein HAHE_28510 [Haloferula helveola]|uniref:Dienelactone hydrolase domain-containing protein n=2 Tax=Haloferula helveola TaxID=490095 RepID=A0ABN6H6Y3_9BACT|nr:hypothetical protein HAHE_28510 [Haloferula helveola]
MTIPLCAAPTESKGTHKVSSGHELSYLLFEPDPALLPAGKPRPLVVFLHGAGERGDDLEKVKKHGPPTQAMEGAGLPFVLLAPQCPPGQWWDTDDVIDLIRHVAKEQSIDPKRIHLTGLSMGGFGTWNILAKAPELFASAVPICGAGEPKTAGAFKDMPIWAFHGTADEAVPVDGTRKMEAALEKADATDFRATYYDGVGHDSWTRTYSNPAVYAWMMLQSR